MNNPQISVILPVYNVEDYLEETLNSLLKQTLIEDLEILMVDDGSTDNSRHIIEECTWITTFFMHSLRRMKGWQ